MDDVPKNPLPKDKVMSKQDKLIFMIRLSLESALQESQRKLVSKKKFITADTLERAYQAFLGYYPPFFDKYDDTTPHGCIEELKAMKDKYRDIDGLSVEINDHIRRLKKDWAKCQLGDCMDCVINYYHDVQDGEDFHARPCDNPHMLVYVMFGSGKGRGYWPAKVLKVATKDGLDDALVTVEYFCGNHHVAKKISHVLIKDCIHLLRCGDSPMIPASTLYGPAAKSLKKHLELIYEKFDELPVFIYRGEREFDGRVRFFTDEGRSNDDV